MEAAMGLMRRMPPSLSPTALSSLLLLLPQHSSDLLSLVDQPLEVVWDEESGKQFLLCDYNRDGDSHRSPWSSVYFPPLEDGAQPPPPLRELEIEANEIFALYRDQYYEGGTSSVYFWETDSAEGFAACFLIKKDGSQSGEGRRGLLEHGVWDAIHVIEVAIVEEQSTAHYCLTSTVMLSMTSNTGFQGSFNLCGSITRQMEADLSVSEGHVSNMGRMIEEMESKLRNGLDQAAMKAEHNSMMRNSTWELMDKMKKRKLIGIKWVCKLKLRSDGSLDKHKALLVVKGYAQAELDFDETFALTARMVRIRTLIAIAAHYNWPIFQMDVMSTFLNDNLDEEVYVDQHSGFLVLGAASKVCRLKKALYKLK